MSLINFNVQHQYTDLYFNNGQSLRVFFNEFTGNIYKRPKIHPVLRHVIDHKGIYVGKTSDGTGVIIHNHVNPGYATIISWDNFAQKANVTLDDKYCTNDRVTRIAIALQDVINNVPYHPVVNSCQTLVNTACTNERKNDDTWKVIGGIAMAFLGGMAIVAAVDSLRKNLKG